MPEAGQPFLTLPCGTTRGNLVCGQLGIFAALGGALWVRNIIPGFEGFTLQEAAAIGKIGSSDGPTTIFIAESLAPH